MLANGLGKGKGEVIRQALVHIACEVLRRRQAVQQEWTVQHLTMVAYGIGKAADQQEVQEALVCLAQGGQRAAIDGGGPAGRLTL